MRVKRFAAIAAATALSLGAIAPAFANPVSFSFGGTSSDVMSPDLRPAAQYCRQTGGQVERRRPVYGTNNPKSQWLYLTGDAHFCQYTAKDGSRIHILLTTLYATTPTLAALAYYARTKYNEQCPGGANPASCYCTQLGGSDQFGGTGFGGGGWVMPHTTDVTLEACIFPDLSSIDSWGLFYNSGKIVRGINLSKVLRYHNPR
jgi:putative hemolysin